MDGRFCDVREKCTSLINYYDKFRPVCEDQKGLLRPLLCLAEKLQMRRHIPAIYYFNSASRGQSTSGRAQPKKGRNKWRTLATIDIFTPAYPEYVNKCVKVLFQWGSLHWKRQPVVPAMQHSVSVSGTRVCVVSTLPLCSS